MTTTPEPEYERDPAYDDELVGHDVIDIHLELYSNDARLRAVKVLQLLDDPAIFDEMHDVVRIRRQSITTTTRTLRSPF